MREKRSEIDCICFAFILLCIFEGLFGCFHSIFEIIQMQNILQSYTTIFILFSILYSFLFYNKKVTLIAVPLMIAFLSMLSGFFRKELLYFFQMLYSIIVLRLNQYFSIYLPMFLNPDTMDLSVFKDGCAVFMLCVLFFLSIDVIGLLKSSRIVFLSAFLFIFGMFIGKLPSTLFIFLLLIGLVGLFSMKSKNQDFQKKWKLRKKTKIIIDCEEQQEAKETMLHSGQKASVFTIICFLSALVLGSFFEILFGTTLLSYHSNIQLWANEFEYNLLHYDYRNLFKNIGGFSKNEGSQGRLSNVKPEYTSKEVLRITITEKPSEAMYFRGFIGKDYNGKQWTNIDEEAFSNVVQDWKMGTVEELEREIENIPYTKLQYHPFTADSMWIEYIDAPDDYAYMPYFSRIPNFVVLNADGIMTRKKTGENTMVNAVYTQTFIQSQSQYYCFYIRNNSNKHIRVDGLERRYSNYVSKQYLNTEDISPSLKYGWEKYRNSSITEVTKAIRQYLKGIEYSLDLERLPYGKDFVEYFLYTQRKGYCIHFATAATLIYRLCNVPARFVEGYVAWPSDFIKNKNGTYTASIPDSRAHAWTEIYYDDIGFLPVDMTPAAAIRTMVRPTNTENSPAEESAANNEIQKETEKLKEPEQPKKAEEKDPKSETVNDDETIEDSKNKNHNNSNKDSSENSGTDIDSESSSVFWKAFKIILYLLRFSFLILCSLTAVFSLFIMGSIFYQKQKYKKQTKKMLAGIKDKKRRNIISISCQLHTCLKLSGYEKTWEKLYGKQLSNRNYETMIQKEFVFLENKDYHRFYQTVQKALYCSPEEENVVSTKELKECREFLKLIQDYLLEQMSGYKKLLLKGIFPNKKRIKK